MKLNPNYKKLFDDLFPDLDDDTIKHIFEEGRQVNLKAGEYLFKQGDNQHSIFIVLLGRLRAFFMENDRKRVLGDIAEGETVGEVAFFTEENRMATVMAIRNSILIEFDPEHYMQLATSHPEFTKALFKLVIKRIQRNTFELNKSAPPRNIAVVCLQQCPAFSYLKNDINQYFKEINSTIHFFEQDALLQTDTTTLFNNLDQNEGMNLLFCDHTNLEWAKQCVIYADLVLIVSDYNTDPDISDIEKQLNIYAEGKLQKKVYLLLTHSQKELLPTNTAKWLQKRKVDLHIHLRNGHKKDIHRLCRILSHKAIGLVLGGGGAKGFAHIGVVKALLEKGFEIDFLGGTSAGALYGIGMAFADFDFQQIEMLNKEAVRRKLTTRDLTLPVFSFMSGKKFKSYLKDMYGDTKMEDIWINTYCVSANLTLANMHLHRTGNVWKQILASMAIPGIFPPVIIDGCLHVDGGVMDNLPIEPMYNYPVDTIIAVSLHSMNIRKLTVKDLPSPRKMLLNKLRGKKKYHLPGITSLLTNSLIINSKQKETATRNKVTHYLRLELKGVKMLEDKHWEEIVDKGYEQTRAYFSSL